MKHMLHPKSLTILISSLLLGCMVFWVQAQTKKPTPTPTPEKKINIEETILRREGKTKVILKPEFEIVKQSDNTAVARKKTVGTKIPPSINGTFDCSCTKATPGSCKIAASGNTISCLTANGDCGCDLQIVAK